MRYDLVHRRLSQRPTRCHQESHDQRNCHCQHFSAHLCLPDLCSAFLIDRSKGPEDRTSHTRQRPRRPLPAEPLNDSILTRMTSSRLRRTVGDDSPSTLVPIVPCRQPALKLVQYADSLPTVRFKGVYTSIALVAKLCTCFVSTSLEWAYLCGSAKLRWPPVSVL